MDRKIITIKIITRLLFWCAYAWVLSHVYDEVGPWTFGTILVIVIAVELHDITFQLVNYSIKGLREINDIQLTGLSDIAKTLKGNRDA